MSFPFNTWQTASDPCLLIPEYRSEEDAAPCSFSHLSYADVYAMMSGFPVSFESCRIALVIENNAWFALCYLSLLQMKNVVICPLNPALQASELEDHSIDYQIDHWILASGDTARRGFCPNGGSTGLWEISVHGRAISLASIPLDGWGACGPATKRSVSSSSASDVVMMLGTSGSTGKPKRVPITRAQLVLSCQALVASYALSRADRILLVMPLYHVHGLIGCLLSTLLSGGSIILPLGKFSLRRFPFLLFDGEASWTSASPTIYHLIFGEPSNVARFQAVLKSERRYVRFLRVCSAPLSEARDLLYQQHLTWCDRFIPFVQAYAMTEAHHQITCRELDPNKQDWSAIGTVGRERDPSVMKIRVFVELDGEAKLVREPNAQGEIALQGPTLIQAYEGSDDTSTAASFLTVRQGPDSGTWFLTGDIGCFDAQLNLKLIGRVSELCVNRGGEKIHPMEIDAALESHPDVQAAISFGLDDPIYGQVPYSIVILRTSSLGRRKLDNAATDVRTQAKTEAELLAHARQRLAKFKVPKRILFTSLYPMTSTGKIQRAKVKQLAEEFFSRTRQQHKL